MPKNEAAGKVRSVLVETNRLLIRRPEENDGPSLERLFCDSEMMRYLGGTWTPEKVAEAFEWWEENWGVNNCWYGTLLRKDTLELVGMAGFTENTIPDEPGLELSWFVLPEHQRLGFATEITNALLRFAFDDLGAQRMIAETHPENPASIRVLEKLCFECLGEQQHSYDYLPGFETQVLWGLNRENWRAEKEGTA